MWHIMNSLLLKKLKPIKINNMEIYNEFMHIYFYVYIVLYVLALVLFYNKKDKDAEFKKKVDFWSMIGLVIFIMSIKHS